ncbi:MAG TPA: ammonia-forming cytochrome c nitrite reductase subunit c552 [Roseomonas sp.]|nr:ammonia-forming cytochrome c nitrite reductase subunit c552 [Roseomonas sp.]
MAQHFSPSADTILRAALAGAALMVVAFLAVLLIRPYTAYSTSQNRIVEQPVQFSHAHHVGGLGLDCRYCHDSVENSAFAGLPPTHTCMTCHSQLWTNAEMLAPVRRSLGEGKPIPWQRVNQVPDYVYFDHSVHVKNGVGCSTCHGPVHTMQQVWQDKPLTMQWCLDCHRDPAQFLRPEDKILDMNWTPPADQEERGRKLIQHYLIETKNLTDCSRCHR